MIRILALIVLLFALPAQAQQIGPGGGGNLSGDCTTSGSLVTTCNFPHPGYIASYWYLPVGISSNSTATAVAVANTIYCSYGIIPKAVTIEGLGIRTSSGNVGSHATLAIYANSVSSGNGKGVPGALVAGLASVLTPTTGSTNFSGALSSNVQIGPSGSASSGRDFWFCYTTDNTSNTMLGISVNGILQSGFNGAANVNTAMAGIAGVSCSTCQGTPAWSVGAWTWPSDLSTSTWGPVTTGIIPLIVFQVVSYP